MTNQATPKATTSTTAPSFGDSSSETISVRTAAISRALTTIRMSSRCLTSGRSETASSRRPSILSRDRSSRIWRIPSPRPSRSPPLLSPPTRSGSVSVSASAMRAPPRWKPLVGTVPARSGEQTEDLSRAGRDLRAEPRQKLAPAGVHRHRAAHTVEREVHVARHRRGQAGEEEQLVALGRQLGGPLVERCCLLVAALAGELLGPLAHLVRAM